MKNLASLNDARFISENGFSRAVFGLTEKEENDRVKVRRKIKN